MDASDERNGDATTAKHPTTVERRSDRELVVTRIVDAPRHLVFEAWTKAELFARWWVPKSIGITLLACELDVRVGGKYRLVFAFGDDTMEFFGVYTDVTPPSRLAWTNDEGDGPGPVTTVTFEDRGDQTQVVVSELHPSKEDLDATLASGSSMDAMPEALAQLEELLRPSHSSPAIHSPHSS